MLAFDINCLFSNCWYQLPCYSKPGVFVLLSLWLEWWWWCSRNIAWTQWTQAEALLLQRLPEGRFRRCRHASPSRWPQYGLKQLGQPRRHSLSHHAQQMASATASVFECVSCLAAPDNSITDCPTFHRSCLQKHYSLWTCFYLKHLTREQVSRMWAERSEAVQL